MFEHVERDSSLMILHLGWHITISFSFIYPNSFMNFVIHMASLVAYVLAMYSTSVVDKAIMDCCLLLQKIVPFQIMNTNHVVDFLSSRPPTQFESQYLTKSWGDNPLKHNLNSKMPCKYQKMRVATLSLRLATKARGCELREKPGSHITCSRESKECEGMNPHTLKWTPMLGVEASIYFQIFKT